MNLSRVNMRSTAFMAPLPHAPVAPVARGLPFAAERIMYLPSAARARPAPRSLLAPSLRRQYASGGGAGFGAGSGGWGWGDWGKDGHGHNDERGASLVIGGLVARYSRELLVRPYRTKAITTGLLMMLSDYLAQALTTPGLQLERLARFLFYGLAVAGPVTHWWFALIERHCAAGLVGAAQMAALDQFIAAPVLLGAFILFMHIAEGSPIRGNETLLREKHKDALLASIRVWPIVNMINFSIVPSPYRVVFGSAFNVVWIAYLSVTTAANSNAQLDDSAILANASG